MAKPKTRLLQKSSYKPKKKRRGGKAVLWTVLIIILILGADYGAYFFFQGPLPAKVLIIGHRGAAALAPENTLTAFRKAGTLKTDGFELDIQMAKDGELVIMHDETVERTTDGQGAVRDLTYQQLRALTVTGGGVRTYLHRSPDGSPGKKSKYLCGDKVGSSISGG